MYLKKIQVVVSGKPESGLSLDSASLFVATVSGVASPGAGQMTTGEASCLVNNHKGKRSNGDNGLEILPCIFFPTGIFSFPFLIAASSLQLSHGVLLSSKQDSTGITRN